VLLLDELDAMAPRRTAGSGGTMDGGGGGGSSAEQARLQPYIPCARVLCFAREFIQRRSRLQARMVSQLLALLDDVSKLRGKDVVVVVATSCRPQAIDPAVRRAGRFDSELLVPLPDPAARAQILRRMSAEVRLGATVDLDRLARRTHGFTAAGAPKCACQHQDRPSCIDAAGSIFHMS
jgi:ribosome biogenesis ATPase